MTSDAGPSISRDGQTKDSTVSRIDCLEIQYKNALRFFQFTLGAITLTVLAVGINLTIQSATSRSEVGDAIRDMERKFELLAGESMRKAELSIRYDGGIVDNTVIEQPYKAKSISMSKFKIKNVGDRVTGEVSVRMHFSESVQLGLPWNPCGWIYEGYKTSCFYKLQALINPDETWVLSPIQVGIDENVSDEILMRVEVFYGDVQPVRADVVIRRVRAE